MIIHLVAGGPRELLPALSSYHNEEVLWVGVDRGVYELLQSGISPHSAFGDFDSINRQEWDAVQDYVEDLHLYPAEKDQTDLEIAIEWAVSQEPELIRVFGATGGRLDHFLGNIGLLERGLAAAISIQLIDKGNMIEVFSPGKYEISKNDLKYISFLPLHSRVEGITLTGFKYPLYNQVLKTGSTLCISNELVMEKGTFSFSTGIIMMIRSKD